MHEISAKIKSKCMMTDMPVMILVPEDTGQTFPVIWLFHGATESGEDLLAHCSLSRFMDRQEHKAVLVLPDGLNSDFANQPQFGTGYQFADFFFDELMPFVYHTTCASEDPAENYITGYSMGGAAALMLGLFYPEKFGLIAPLGSAVREYEFLQDDLSLTGDAFRTRALADPKAYPTEYGDPAEGITFKEINMISKFPTVQGYVDSMECTGKRFEEADFENLPPIWFCCGGDDLCQEKVKAFVNHAHDLGDEHVSCKILPGLDHSAEKECVQAMIRYAAQIFQR